MLRLLRLLLLPSLFLVATSLLFACTVLEVLLQGVESLHRAWLLHRLPLFIAQKLLPHSSSCFCVCLACSTLDRCCDLLVNLPSHSLVVVESELLLNEDLGAVADLLKNLVLLNLLLLRLQLKLFLLLLSPSLLLNHAHLLLSLYQCFRWQWLQVNFAVSVFHKHVG